MTSQPWPPPKAAPKTPRPLELSEQDWHTQVDEYATLCRWMRHHCRPAQDSHGHWKTPIQGDPGFPDLVLIRGGRILFAELKNNRGVLSTDQMAWRDRLLLAGQEWYCWRPRDWDKVKTTLAPAPHSNWKVAEDVGTGGRI